MKEAIIMTKEEYAEMTNIIKQLQTRLREKMDIIDQMDADLYNAYKRFDALWEAHNRPAIEAAAKAHDEEFYTWCDEMADKYDELDWIECMDRKYNPHPSKACWKKWAEQYESPDNLCESHGWIMKAAWPFYNSNDNYWIMEENINDYSDCKYGTHKHMLWCLMIYYQTYNREVAGDWKSILKELYHVNV